MSGPHEGPESLYHPDNKVALFVDFENLRKSLEHDFVPAPTPQAICEKLYDLANRFGNLLLANAYADWSISSADPREFRRRQIEPRLVLTKENGDDRTDITMSLDALESLYAEPPIDVYVIASGDSDFHDLLQRLKRRNRRIVVCGVTGATGRELIRGADRYVPLDELVGARPVAESGAVDWETYDWSCFIRLIRDLGQKLNFVGLRYVATKVLNPHNCGLSDRIQKQELLNRAIDDGIIIPYQVDNIDENGEPVSACKLNEAHPRVVKILDQGAESDAPRLPTDVPSPADPADVADPAGNGPTLPPPLRPASPPHVPRHIHLVVDGDEMGRPGEVED